MVVSLPNSNESGSSNKWYRKRKYRKRSGLERLNSRLADGCMLHSHYLRGQGNMGLKIIISMTVMLAAANVAIQSQRPEQVRSLIKALAAGARPLAGA